MKTQIIALAILSALATGCKKDKSPVGGRTFTDYGYTSSSTSIGTSQMLYYNSDLIVGTDDGLWKINLNEKVWKKAGLNGKKITCIYNHPTVNGKFFAGVASTGPTDKSLYISDDAGLNWHTATSPVFDSWGNMYETYFDIKVRPGFPNQVFANLSGTTLAISKDGGMTWNRQNYMGVSFFGIESVINFLETKPDEIFQGAEAPLDQAWLGKYSIDGTDPVLTGALDQFIGKNYEWENRRPNCIETFKTNNTAFYVGMEGALSKVEGTAWKYLFKAEQPNNFPYTYIKGIWLDPSDKKHLIFGGGVNGSNTSLSLYETYDEGYTITQISDKLGMNDPDIIDIVATGNYPALLIRDKGNGNKLRVLVYKY